jgi:hypothetical protein
MTNDQFIFNFLVFKGIWSSDNGQNFSIFPILTILAKNRPLKAGKKEIKNTFACATKEGTD